MHEPTRIQDHDDVQSPSDESLIDLARRSIEASRLRPWSQRLKVCCHDGNVTLSGHLPSFYLKQVLQTIVINLPGVLAVDNGVHVSTSSAPLAPGDHRDVQSP